MNEIWVPQCRQMDFTGTEVEGFQSKSVVVMVNDSVAELHKQLCLDDSSNFD